MSASPYYPRWIKRFDGVTAVVADRNQHMALTKRHVTEEGVELDEPVPPVADPAPLADPPIQPEAATEEVEDKLGLFKE